jgi:hypothetical protein
MPPQTRLDSRAAEPSFKGMDVDPSRYVLPAQVRAASPSVHGLLNPRGGEAAPNVWGTLLAKQGQMGLPRKLLWRVWRRTYAVWRGVKRLARAIIDEVSAAPKKTIFDLLTGFPLGLLVLPAAREWAFGLPFATWGFCALVTLRVVYGIRRRMLIKTLIRDEVGAALTRMMPIIECSSIHVQASHEGGPLPATQLARNVEAVLSAVAEIVGQALQVPGDVHLTANLMIRMPVLLEDGTEAGGCGIVAYSKMPANPSWTRLVLGDLGAGQAFQTGKVQAVEDTSDPVWCGLLKHGRSKCFASFPVRHGAVVIAVVNVDCDRPMILTRKNAARLFVDVLVPPLKLLGDLLVASQSVSVVPLPAPK